jgi:hypothetical protein
MQEFKPNSKLRCPYCKEESEYKADDYVGSHSTVVHPELCNCCHQEFLVRRREDGIILVDNNWTYRIYQDKERIRKEYFKQNLRLLKARIQMACLEK